MTKLNKSPDRRNRSSKHLSDMLMKDETSQAATYLMDFYDDMFNETEEFEKTAEWRKDNLEYDLRSSPIIQEKCKDNGYAQNLYAALCNNEFRKNEVVPILTEQAWSCTWRYSGGIVADILEKGDYIDWYGSGISDRIDITESDFAQMNQQQQVYYAESMKYVPEGRVTEEIKQDLFNLGWIVV